jgi:hypothetical protein
MKGFSRTVAAILASFMAVGGHALAQQSSSGSQKADTYRPSDPTANLPSDSGSQTTLPSGAVTGAGLPYGKGKQPDIGAPGGAEPRAREEARQEMRGTGSATGAGGVGEAGASTPTKPKSER